MIILFSGWLASLAVVAVLLSMGRNVAFERAQRSTDAFSMIVQENVARALHAVDITLATVADAYRLAAPVAMNDPQFQTLLQDRLRDLPDVRALFVVDANGRIVHDTDFPHTPERSLADRSYFRKHAQDPVLGRAISRPLQSYSGKGYFLALTNRLGKGSRFEGIVVAAMQADHLESQFGKIGMEQGDVIALLHRSGELVASFPSRAPETAKSFAHVPLFTEHLPQADGGTFVTTRSIHPGRRVVSYRTVAGTPLVVYVSRDLDSTFTEWRRSAAAAAIAVVALTLLLSAFIVRLVKDSREREQQRLQNAQAEKLEALGQLTGGIAHDFGNLVNILKLNLELMRVLPPVHPARAKALETAQRATTRATELIARLLDFASARPAQRIACDVNDHVTRSGELLAQAAGPGVDIALELSPDLPRVLCDPGQLDVALVNLVVNASHAMAGKGRVRLSTARSEFDPARGPQKRSAPAVCLAIKDSGSGMSAEIQRRVLEPFFTTKGGGGTGLGLTQVYGFMQQIGGELRIESARGAGTTVYLYFQLA